MICCAPLAHLMIFYIPLVQATYSYVFSSLLRLQWRQDIDEAARLIEKAMEVDSKCEFAYETLGTIEIQRFHIFIICLFRVCHVCCY